MYMKNIYKIKNFNEIIEAKTIKKKKRSELGLLHEVRFSFHNSDPTSLT